MSYDVQQVRSFEHPGEGRKRAKSTPKGRQVDPTAAHEIELLLGDRPRRRDLLIEYLHLIQDTYRPDLRRASGGAGRRDAAGVRGGVRDRDLLRAFRRREGRRARLPPLTVRVCDSADLRACWARRSCCRNCRTPEARACAWCARPASVCAMWRRRSRSAITSFIRATSSEVWRRPRAARPHPHIPRLHRLRGLRGGRRLQAAERSARRRDSAGSGAQGARRWPACAASAAPAFRPGANGARCAASRGRG